MKRGEKIVWFCLSVLFCGFFLFGIFDARPTDAKRQFVVLALVLLLFFLCFFLYILRIFKLNLFKLRLFKKKSP